MGYLTGDITLTPMSKIWDQKNHRFRETMKYIRKESGLTQAQLADRIHKPQSYISKYESGERRLDFIEVLEICEACENYDVGKIVDSIRSTKQSFDKES